MLYPESNYVMSIKYVHFNGDSVCNLKPYFCSRYITRREKARAVGIEPNFYCTSMYVCVCVHGKGFINNSA